MIIYRAGGAPCLTSGSSVDSVAAVLRELATATGNPHLARAAALLARRGGRPAIDDTGAVALIGWHLERGDSATVESAARMVALTMGGQSIDATSKRLARKFRMWKGQAQNP